MNITLIGHVCIDENVSETASYTSWGSALMYIANYYKSQGEDNVSLIAPYGKDFLPYSNDANILNHPDNKPTLIYKNMSNHGDRTQKCENVEHALPVPLDDKLRSNISQADIIILAPLLPNYSAKYVTELLSYKKASSLCAVLPQGYFRSVLNNGNVTHRSFLEASRLLPLFDIMIFSEDDISNDSNVLQNWAKQNPEIKIIMTQGDKGASWVRINDTYNVGTHAIPENEIVDSVGSGDIFSAAAIRNYYLSNDVKTAISAGNMAAGKALRLVNKSVKTDKV